ncbi:MAG: hypothetical protein M3425_03850 [Actinomycetota bacterium]|nr:hypothetical protein [Actinomycetota bacterium]
METQRMEHKVVAVRATGLMPTAVADSIADELDEASGHGWDLKLLQPIIYNSSTTGYLLLIFHRPLATAE